MGRKARQKCARHKNDVTGQYPPPRATHGVALGDPLPPIGVAKCMPGVDLQKLRDFRGDPELKIPPLEPRLCTNVPSISQWTEFFSLPPSSLT
jgi:hypothetical protein